MVFKHIRKYENQIIGLGFILVLIVFTAIRYDFYFDMNDDVFMKDILSGVYTGTPEGHNIQMQYPLSLLISILYRIFPKAPVYGSLLCILQYFSLYLIIERSLSFRKSVWSKLLMGGLECIVFTALFFKHFVFLHYTVTCGLLAATAAFLFVTGEAKVSGKGFIKKNIPSILLIIIAFSMRSEMLLLLLPLICVAGIYKWSEEKDVFTIDNIKKYLSVFGLIIGGIAVVFIINALAFGGNQWKSYVQFFDSRTELYDFHEIPPYEENRELYDKLGLAESERELLFKQYNFGLDEAIDAPILETMAQYQKQQSKEIPFGEVLKSSFANYRYRLLHKDSDFPWNIMLVASYVFVFVAVILNSFKSILQITWQLSLLGIVRTGLWMFLIVRNRYPERITHPLYLVELCILWAILFIECRKMKALVVFPVMLSLFAIFVLPGEMDKLDLEYAGRMEANITDSSMKSYCKDHKDNFYFFDVYSSVSDPVTSLYYSEKVFVWDRNQLANYDIMGGWLTKSPSYYKKMDAFGIDSMQEALVDNGNVYMMMELAKDITPFIDYYKDQNLQVNLELVDTIHDIIGVYQIKAEGEFIK